MIVDNDPGQVETMKSALSHQEDFEILVGRHYAGDCDQTD